MTRQFRFTATATVTATTNTMPPNSQYVGPLPPAQISPYSAEEEKEWDEKVKQALTTYLKTKGHRELAIPYKLQQWRESPEIRNYIPDPIAPPVESPAVVARRARLQKSWEEKVKQERYDFDIAAGRSEEEAQRRQGSWHEAHMGGPGFRAIWRMMKVTPHRTEQIDEKIEKDKREWGSEENYGRMVSNLGGVPKGACWDRGELKGPYWRKMDEEAWYKRLGPDSSPPKPPEKRSRKK